MNDLLRTLWAKSAPHHPLWCHLLDTAAVARALIGRFGTIDGLPEGWIEFLVGCHDVGKADRWFQNKDDRLAKDLEGLGLKLPSWVSGTDSLKKFRHEARSREWLQKILKSKYGWRNRSENIVAKAIVGHHGDWAPSSYSERDYADVPTWEFLRDELGTMLWKTLKPVPCSLDRFPHASSAGAKLAAYVILSDWIASNDALFQYESLPESGTPEEYFVAACKRAIDVVKQMKLDVPEFQSEISKPAFKEVWPDIKKLRPLQEHLELCREQLLPGLAIIEAPMGEGKTEAAIYLAMLWQAGFATRGVYFALPTQATANAMHDRYADFLQDWRPNRRARLMHGGAWLRDETPEKLEYLPELLAQDRETALKQARSARDWFRPMRRALLASEGVGTVDQALLCALRVKFGPLRLLGLSQKTLIIDEVHAYDEFMGVLLERLLQWCRALDVNVILLSATLSQSQKMVLCKAYAGEEVDLSPLQSSDAKKAAYPLLSFVPREGIPFSFTVEADSNRKRDLEIDVKPSFLNDFVATAKLCAATIKKEGGCACILVNTVRAAQEIFRELEKLEKKGELPEECDLMLFHARFRIEKRAEIEKNVVSKFGKKATQESNPPRPKNAILVATQVVEQSLDVDFDFFFSQLAPIDLLLQRAGRLWRHERKERPTSHPILTILAPPLGDWDFGASGKVYQPEILLRTLALCDDVTIWKLSEDFRDLIERCYDRSENLGNFSLKVGFEQNLAQAISVRDLEIAEAKNDAKIHCWIKPETRTFEPVMFGAQEADEDSGKQPKFFVAQTRRGDQSVAILAMWKPKHFEIAVDDAKNADLPRQQQRMPLRNNLVEIFEQKVGVPRWWFNGIEPLEGFDSIEEGKSYLRGHKLLPLKEIDGIFQWYGHDAKGKFTIVDHPQLGLLRRALDAPETEETLLEADGGFNTP